MNRILALVLTFALTAPWCAAASAAKNQANGEPKSTLSVPRPKSPHETISLLTAKGNRITIVYGRPFTRDPKNGRERKIWGELVPYGKIWRLGADEATLFITQRPLQIGTADVPAGAYTLWMLLNADGSAQLIINKEIGQWGLLYREEYDFARVPLQAEELKSAVHQFTIAIENDGPEGGALRFMWDRMQYSVRFVVK